MDLVEPAGDSAVHHGAADRYLRREHASRRWSWRATGWTWSTSTTTWPRSRILMISARMWRKLIKPLHERIIDVAKAYGIPVMYHCDGALYPLIPELIEMGVDVLNPVQADAAGMEPQRLKDEFGDRLSFHGGIDIIKTLPRGSAEDVRGGGGGRIRVLGRNGGYILASSHHIQSDTPLANVFAMYDMALRNQ